MSRQKSGEHYEYGTHEYDLSKAAKILFENELGFGGNVTEITKTSITVITHFFGCVDTTIITSSREEMVPLIEGTYLFLKSSEDYKEETFKQGFEDMCGDQNGVTPLLMEIGFEIIRGANRLKAAIMYTLGITDKETISLGLTFNLEDILIAVEMQKEGCGTFREILSWA